MKFLDKIPTGTTPLVIGSILFVCCQVFPWRWMSQLAEKAGDGLFALLTTHAVVSTLLGVWVLGSLASLLTVFVGLSGLNAWLEDRALDKLRAEEGGAE